MNDPIGVQLRQQVDDLTRDIVLPPATAVTRTGRRRRAQRRAGGAGLVVALLVLAGVVVGAERPPDEARGPAAPDSAAAQPDEQRLREVLASLAPAVRVTSVEQLPPGPLDLGRGGPLRRQLSGISTTSTDSRLSLSWSVLAPALSAAEAEALAREGSGTLIAVPEAQAVSGDIRSLGYVTDDAFPLARVVAWSGDGGLVLVTAGLDPREATVSARTAALAAAARALLDPPG